MTPWAAWRSFGCGAYRRFAAAQEGVDQAFASKRGRQRDFVAVAALLHVGQHVAYVAVAGFDDGRELEIRERVFVRAEDARGVGQGSQAVKRVEHLGGSAFKQATATSAEQGIAAEQRAMACIGNVAERVSRNG